jgi:release factor glutamine methyltransferase
MKSLHDAAAWLPDTPATVEDALQGAVAALAAGLPSVRPEAARDAELLLCTALGWTRTQLRIRGHVPLPAPARQQFANWVQRRAAGEPVAYLLGEREFWSLALEVGPGVLVPRADTECLVEVALAFLQDCLAPAVLDLGTGTGAIAIAIAHTLDQVPAAVQVRVVAVEREPAALAMAARNIARHVAGRVDLRRGDWYQAVSGERFTVIVSNPPYLGSSDPHLPALAHEPATALVSGPSGLECLAQLVAGAAEHLAPGGLLALEHGAEQGTAVRALLAAAGFVAVRTQHDLAGLERVTCGQRPQPAAS